MNIVLFEKDHFEGSYPIIKLFDNGKNKITIFCYEHTYRQFKFLFKDDATNYNWVVKEHKASKYLFMLKLYLYTIKQKTDILYLNTVSDNFIFYGLITWLLRTPRVILTMHSINSFFERRPPYTIRKWVRFYGGRFLIHHIKEFNVVSTTMVNYLKSKLPNNKKVHCVPGAVYEGRNPQGEHRLMSNLSVIKITVPGTVDVRRRNYEVVFALLEQCSVAGVKISITLAGGYYGEDGKKIIDRARQYSKINSNLIFFEKDVLDQPEFDAALDECHFVFIPTQITTVIVDDVPETYGKSIGSGNLFDIVKHAKPFIAPMELEFDSFLHPSCFRYPDVDAIVQYLKKFQQNPSLYTTLKQAAVQASGHYTIEKVRERNAEVFHG